jgi:hypothetical protein
MGRRKSKEHKMRYNKEEKGEEKEPEKKTE